MTMRMRGMVLMWIRMLPRIPWSTRTRRTVRIKTMRMTRMSRMMITGTGIMVARR